MKLPPNFFFLLLSLPPKVNEKVSFLKNFVKESIGHTYDSFYSKGHVTLRQYYDFHNESKLYTFQERISHIRPFEVFIEGFRVFENSRTIFLDIKLIHQICDLVQQLDHSISHPHITIAKNLPQRDFNLVWPAIQRFEYSNHFTCDHVTVLKRIANRWADHLKLPFSKP